MLREEDQTQPCTFGADQRPAAFAAVMLWRLEEGGVPQSREWGPAEWVKQWALASRGEAPCEKRALLDDDDGNRAPRGRLGAHRSSVGGGRGDRVGRVL